MHKLSKAVFSVSLSVLLTVGVVTTVSAQSTQSAELRPGRWSVDHSLHVPAQGFTHNETQGFCLDETEASISFDDILRSLNFGECRASNAVLTLRTGRADVTCTYPDYGNATSTGTLEATYSDTNYRVEGHMVGRGAGIVAADYLGIGRWVGEC